MSSWKYLAPRDHTADSLVVLGFKEESRSSGEPPEEARPVVYLRPPMGRHSRVGDDERSLVPMGKSSGPMHERARPVGPAPGYKVQWLLRWRRTDRRARRKRLSTRLGTERDGGRVRIGNVQWGHRWWMRASGFPSPLTALRPLVISGARCGLDDRLMDHGHEVSLRTASRVVGITGG